MKTTLIALNEKLVLLGDIRNDVDDGRQNFSESERLRGQLQIQIIDFSE